MYEHDYVMRLINEMIRTLLKLVCNIDLKKEETDTQIEVKTGQIINGFYDLVDEGKINEAENLLLDTLDESNMGDLEIALEFYSYINSKDDEYLQRCDYSRGEIAAGIKMITKRYGCEGIADIFFN